MSQAQSPVQVRKFTINVDEIKKNVFYKNVIKTMPKGALLHCHVSAIVNVYDYLQYLKTNNKDIYDKMYFLTDPAKLDEFIKKIETNYNDFFTEVNKNTSIQQILNLPQTYDIKNLGKIIFQKDTNSLIYLENGDPYGGAYEAVSTMKDEKIKAICDSYKMKDITEYNWDKLHKATPPYWTIYRDLKYYLHYFRFFLNNCINEGLQHVEIKMSLGWFYDMYYAIVKLPSVGDIPFYYIKPYEEYVNTDLIKIEDILSKIKTTLESEYKDKITFSLIGAIGKARKTDYCKIDPSGNSCLNCSNTGLKNICSLEHINTIDLQGEEDKSIPITLYLGQLIQDCSTKNLVIHSGETITDNNAYNSNLMSMAFLRNANLDALKYKPVPVPVPVPVPASNIQYNENFFTKKIHRVGHGLDLNRSDNIELYNMFKKLKIHVELCPLSNYILNYTKDLSKHPGKKYLDEGIRVSINSDDPSPFGYDDVSFDWLFAIMYWNLTLADIYKLAMYSLEDSIIDDITKAQNIKKFNTEWTTWKTLKIPKGTDDITPLNILFESKFNNIKSMCELSPDQIDAEQKFQDTEIKKAHPLPHQVGGYYEKYMKYKQKYLQLKKQL